MQLNPMRVLLPIIYTQYEHIYDQKKDGKAVTF